MEHDMLLVKADVLPDVFQRVVEAKHLLACKKASSATEAAKMCGISRSAFYKYRDAVFSYRASAEARVVNLSAVLEDKAGVLANFIAVLYSVKVNILTVNQGMPSGGVAQVTVSYRDKEGEDNTEKILSTLSKTEGVITLERILGDL